MGTIPDGGIYDMQGRGGGYVWGVEAGTYRIGGLGGGKGQEKAPPSAGAGRGACSCRGAGVISTSCE